jgi:hypothetical protein
MSGLRKMHVVWIAGGRAHRGIIKEIFPSGFARIAVLQDSDEMTCLIPLAALAGAVPDDSAAFYSCGVKADLWQGELNRRLGHDED